MIKKSFGEFIKGGTVAFVEGAMGYNFLYVIAKMSEGREVMFLSAHLESYQKRESVYIFIIISMYTYICF